MSHLAAVMANSTVLAIHPREDRSCVSGYLWWVCAASPGYRGCRAVDACQQNPIGCPPHDQMPETAPISMSFSSPWITSSTVTPSSTKPSLISSSLTKSSASFGATFLSSSSTSPSLSPSSIIPKTSSLVLPAPAASSDTSTDTGGAGVVLPVGTLVGIIVGCCVFAGLVVLGAYMLWGKYKRKGDDEGGVARAFIPQRGHERDYIPDPYDSQTAGAASGSTHVPDTPELDSSAPRSPVPELESPTSAVRQEITTAPAEEYHAWRPRATLSPTEWEVNARTYANSWTKFGDVQDSVENIL
ncbi:hypothetical protein B0T17DRAFT_504851 [Bombardia bombarda]|uniref:Uncharacterized protein n=1 Tax=Bombardia bombarda TaxID=252184 RepID=A0AA40C788_9PEZI|nr:hypothetical protein B0T17DRAFT_504851 [Bombardia bombarda]